MEISPFSQLVNDMDEGTACLWMIVRYYDKDFPEATFRQKVNVNTREVAINDLSRAAEKIGFRARWVKLTYGQLIKDAPVPCILKWDQDRFFILLPQSTWSKGKKLKCAKPAEGITIYTKEELLHHWAREIRDDGKKAGSVMLLEPTFEFRNRQQHKPNKLTWRVVLQFFQRSRWQIAQLICALLITSLVQLVVPFLMQSIVDVGINTQDLDYITIILIAQLMLVLSRVSVDLVRARLLLHISTTVNLSILSNFWIKLTRLPISYFDRHHTGDVLQRINDNKQLQSFLTGPALNTMFSILNFVVFAIVLMMYQVKLFFIFSIGIILYFTWMRFFLSIRRKINYELFHTNSKENNTTIQMVQGMQEIRLHNIEQSKRWEWESRQVEIFRINFKRLTYGQLQQAGAILINQGKDVILTFTVAKLLINGQLTFGAMLAIQYIIGQLSGPIEQLIGFIQHAQDARISMERLNEIHEMEEEEKEGKQYQLRLPHRKMITLQNLSFRYPGADTMPVLNNIQLKIPEGKTTAIVGESGSGKTTLLKLLLKFYDNYEGTIRIGDTDFRDIGPAFWRDQCGAILQDGFIFNDTIARNIALQYDELDVTKLREACRMANILSFIESLPDTFHTRLGAAGVGISQGQKQRILIARAIYKDPRFLFLDESTNSLDETNERAIVENLQVFAENRTTIVIAHRLSTVRNADNIVVLHQGRIVEQGTHEELARVKGRYFRLVKSQLELGID